MKKPRPQKQILYSPPPITPFQKTLSYGEPQHLVQAIWIELCTTELRQNICVRFLLCAKVHFHFGKISLLLRQYRCKRSARNIIVPTLETLLSLLKKHYCPYSRNIIVLLQKHQCPYSRNTIVPTLETLLSLLQKHQCPYSRNIIVPTLETLLSLLQKHYCSYSC